MPLDDRFLQAMHQEIKDRAVLVALWEESMAHIDWTNKPLAAEWIWKCKSQGFTDFPELNKDFIINKIAVEAGIDVRRVSSIFTLKEVHEVRTAVIHGEPPRPIISSEDEIYMIPGFFEKYITYASGNRAPIAFHWWSGSGAAGAACRRWVYFERIDPIYPNLYLTFCGPSGGGKSTAIHTAVKLLSRMNELMDEEEMDRQMHMTILPDVITPENIYDYLAPKRDDGQGLQESIGILVNDEVATLLGKQSWNSDGIIHLLTQLYDGRSSTKSTRGRGPQTLKNVVMNFMAGSTPDWIRSSVTEDMFSGGFMGRCINIYRPENNSESFPHPRPHDPILREELAQVLKRLSQGYITDTKDPLSMAMCLSEKADVEYQAWFRRTEKYIVDPYLGGFYQRRDIHLLKNCMTVEATSTGHREISLETVQRVIEIIERETRHFPQLVRLVGESDQGRVKRRVFEAIRLEWPEAIQQVELYKQFGHTATRKAMNMYIQDLIEVGSIEKVTENREDSTRGRPKVFLRLVPEDEDALDEEP